MKKFATKLVARNKQVSFALPKQLIGKRYYAIEAKAVRFQEWGNPKRVLKYGSVQVDDQLKQGQVLVKMQAAPINPSDLNVVQGTYPTKVKPPAVAGGEGVGVVEKVGENVSDLQVNDRVVLASDGLGTWASHFVCDRSELFKVSQDIPLEYAASLSINPLTALRLLEDFEQLKEGDTLIQNAANSMVGLSVIQLAAAKGIKTINIVRDRSDHEEVIEKLKQYGGHVVVTESYLRSSKFKSLISDLPKPKLALNGTSGYSATEIARQLDQSGTLVSYGAMANKPVQLPPSLFIFKNISAKGFWLKHWIANHSRQERQQALNYLQEAVTKKQLRLWLEYHNLSSFDWALDRYYEPFKNRKIVLHLDK